MLLIHLKKTINFVTTQLLLNYNILPYDYSVISGDSGPWRGLSAFFKEVISQIFQLLLNYNIFVVRYDHYVISGDSGPWRGLSAFFKEIVSQIFQLLLNYNIFIVPCDYYVISGDSGSWRGLSTFFKKRQIEFIAYWYCFVLALLFKMMLLGATILGDCIVIVGRYIKIK